MGRPRLLIPPGVARPPQTAQGDRVVRFVRQLTHSKGEYQGQPFRLRPWQERILRELFGRLGRDGRRQYRTCYLEIPRKNGKTELAAAIALYLLLADKEPGAEVYGAAVDRDQASLVFHAAEAMVRADPELTRHVEIIPSQRRIVVPSTASVYRAIPGDAPSAHGYNAHAVIYDELHAAPNRALWDVLTTSMGARRQPLILVITTAGWDRSSICWELHAYAEKVRDGVVTNPTFLPILYGAPLDADWQAESVWRQANPALGDFRSLEEMRLAYHQAKDIPARQNAFKQLYLCQWTESHSRWLDLTRWTACPTGATPAELVGVPCYGGLDLGQTDDFSAFVRVWVLPTGRVVARCRFWLPEAALEKYRHRPYATWQAGGELTVTPGDICDYDAIEAEVATLCQAAGVREVAYDKRFAQQLALHLEGQGITMVDTPQGFQLNEALRKLSDLVVSGQLDHGGDPVLTWMAGNAIVRQGQRGEIRLDKQQSGDKIDGIAALAMAMARVVSNPGEASVYDGRGLVQV